MSLNVVILAAGQGKRMHSKLPKVLHPLLFRPMIDYVLDAAFALKPSKVLMVVGHGAEKVVAHCKGREKLQFVTQSEQKGTGHAVQMTSEFLSSEKGDVLILSGDVALITAETLKTALLQHRNSGAKATVITAMLTNPKGYGRMIRNSEGKLVAIREQVDCTDAEAAVNEVNSGTYCFDCQSLFAALTKLNSNNNQGEFYLTDTLSTILGAGGKVETALLRDPNEMLGINDRLAASEVESLLQKRINDAWMLNGVTLREPKSIWIDTRSQLSSDVTIEGGCTLINTTVGEGTHLKPGCYIEDSIIGEHCTVGPYAHLRPGTVLKRKVKIGNFVELKKSTMDDGAKASHLSYIGDAEVGKNVNIGCGFITCNYNGITKEKTVIEDDVFVGSDSQTVAPVTIGKGSYVASGTTVTKNVPPDSLVISRGRQTVRPGYAKRFQKK